MLVLTLKDGDALRVGEDVLIRIQIDRGAVRFAIDAPKRVRIRTHREKKG